MAELAELLIATFTRLAPERQQLAADCSGDRDSMKLNKPSLVARLSYVWEGFVFLAGLRLIAIAAKRTAAA